MDSLERTLAEIRSKAAELRNSFGDEERARAIEWAASLVERALQEHAEERLTLAEASARSGYSQDHSLKDVAAAGGWKDTETLLTCYQQPDADTLLAVMSEPKKMRDAALASG